MSKQSQGTKLWHCQRGIGMVEKLIILGLFCFVASIGIYLIGDDANTKNEEQGQAVAETNSLVGAKLGASEVPAGPSADFAEAEAPPPSADKPKSKSIVVPYSDSNPGDTNLNFIDGEGEPPRERQALPPTGDAPAASDEDPSIAAIRAYLDAVESGSDPPPMADSGDWAPLVAIGKLPGTEDYLDNTAARREWNYENIWDPDLTPRERDDAARWCQQRRGSGGQQSMSHCPRAPSTYELTNAWIVSPQAQEIALGVVDGTYGVLKDTVVGTYDLVVAAGSGIGSLAKTVWNDPLGSAKKIGGAVAGVVSDPVGSALASAEWTIQTGQTIGGAVADWAVNGYEKCEQGEARECTAFVTGIVTEVVTALVPVSKAKHLGTAGRLADSGSGGAVLLTRVSERLARAGLIDENRIFVGVMDGNGKVLLRNTTSNPRLDPGFWPRNRSHMKIIQEDYGIPVLPWDHDFRAFTVFPQADGSLAVSWKSSSVNGRGSIYASGDGIFEDSREAVLDALSELSGRPAFDYLDETLVSFPKGMHARPLRFISEDMQITIARLAEPGDAIDITGMNKTNLAAHLADQPVEYAVVRTTDGRHLLIRGDRNGVPLDHPNFEVRRIIVHNHPSGDPSLSTQDIALVSGLGQRSTLISTTGGVARPHVPSGG